MPRRNVLARARHRHGRGRPRDPGRVAEVGRARPAARRPRRPQPRRRVEGRIFPKFRADLLESAVVAERMKAGAIEETVIPRNPLDVLAQQIVAICAETEIEVDELHDLVRARLSLLRSFARRSSRTCWTCSRAAIRRTSSRSCKPRIIWDRTAGVIRGRAGRAAARGHERGHDSGPRSLRRAPRRRRRPRWRARRGDGLRGARGPDLPARRVVVADRGDHARPRSGLAAPGVPGRCRSGRARASGGRTSSAQRSASSRAKSSAGRADGADQPAPRPVWTSAPPRTCCSSCTNNRPRPAWFLRTRRSWSSAFGTRSATGASASSPRSARGCTRRGRWRSRRACATRSGSRCSRSGRTTASRCTCQTPTHRRRRKTC